LLQEDTVSLSGEYGALTGADGVTKDNAALYHRFFLDCCDYFDYTSCLWDTSCFFDRRALAFRDADLAAVYISRNQETEIDSSEVRTSAKHDMDALIESAPDTFKNDVISVDDNTAVAWIMWNDGGWSISYSVGDKYDPDSVSPGLKTTDAVINGEGIYTVKLDFTGTSNGYSASTAFSAIGISNGELLFPGYVVDITECRINGEIYHFKGRPYTTSDDGKCTRVNLFNEWVTAVPRDKARVRYGDLTGTTATPINRNDAVIGHIETIEITFWYGPRK